jgi:hypothetical protein
MTKRHRLYNAFAHSQKTRQDRLAVLAFIRKSMRPKLYARSPQRYEPMRAILNRALAFAGLAGKGERRSSGVSSDVGRSIQPLVNHR